MSKRTKRNLITKTETPKTELVINELTLVSADRTTKNIGDFTTALMSAESVYYPQRVLLYDLYSKIMLDGHLTGITEKVIEGVLNKNLFYEDKSGKRIDEMDKTIQSLVFRNIMRKILETPAYGLSGMEFVPGPKLFFKEIPRKHIKPHKKVLSYEQSGEDGISYEGVTNLWVIGDEKDLGFLLKCCPYAIWKSGNMADWAQYIEIFGQPVRIVKYDAYDTKTKMELRQVLDESGSSLALMIPKQADFEMKDGKQSNGDGQLQEKFKKACDDEMSVIVLGNTETTTSSKSSGYAQSKTHGEQQKEKIKSYLKYIVNFLNDEHFIRILQSYGLPVVEGGMFKFEKEIDLAQLKTRLDIDKTLSKIVPVSDDYFYDTYGLPKPDNYDELKMKMEAERQAALTPPTTKPEPAKPAAGKPPKKKDIKDAKPADKKNLMAKSNWLKLRSALADFFDPAP